MHPGLSETAPLIAGILHARMHRRRCLLGLRLTKPNRSLIKSSGRPRRSAANAPPARRKRRCCGPSQSSRPKPIVARCPGAFIEYSDPGQPLDLPTRAFFEPRFGHNLNKVRVHADPDAATSARAVNVQAYTVGSDLVFAERRYAPATDTGRKLLAHELTHSIQQGMAAVVDGPVQRQSDDLAVTDTPPPAPAQGPVPPANPAPIGPAGPQPAKPPCLPVIVNPTWNVGPPVLDTAGQWNPCGLHGSFKLDREAALSSGSGSVHVEKEAVMVLSFATTRRRWAG
jgi:hypothetical protein